MKLKPTFLGAALIAMSPVPAAAALVASYSSANTPVDPTQSFTPPADWDDNLQQPTDFGPVGGLVRQSAGITSFMGWDATLNLNKYVGFRISAMPGFQVNLTDLAFMSRHQGGSSFVQGFRVDGNNDGIFEQSWAFDPITYASGVPGFTSGGGLKPWDFVDFSTPGTVEFGLFGTATTPSGGIETRSLTINGTVTPVPEPSAALLGALGGLALLRRRR